MPQFGGLDRKCREHSHPGSPGNGAAGDAEQRSGSETTLRRQVPVDALIAAAGVLLAGAIPALAGIVLGSVALGIVAVLGAGALFNAEPRLGVVTTGAGCVYLIWLGARALIESAAPTQSAGHSHLPSHASGLFFFQFLNPKAWATVLTVTAAAQTEADVGRTGLLIGLFALIPTVCLTIWAGLGSLTSEYLARPRVAVWFQRSMGAMLIISALLLWFRP